MVFYGVPKETLLEMINKKRKTNKPGRSTDLSDAKENALYMTWLL